MRAWALAVVGLVTLVGCAPTEVTPEQAKSIAAQSTPEKFDAEMKKQGKGAELEDAKKREAAYLEAGKQGSETKSSTPNDPNVNP
ncbi:MAG: hypothetical protein JSS65_13660 [Armatimonadetes bacterium]|nr:hypothetical protein [Armatimonadota bacterium]